MPLIEPLLLLLLVQLLLQLLYCCFTDALRMLCLRQLFSTQHFANIAWAYVFLKVSKAAVKAAVKQQ